ncbi:hypothetical protein C7C46_01195 [Streptomyces tateyamensis]|uniref:Serine protease n=1 Tax=Streptomyces tateyamensis TaxID=565073 RepID=A0A2V4NWE6_9ACTN|nr:hypothetical protein [Streptomyces tateyamensis]PYC88291.1 hypothetical protein C7C46_01195 [Streptomyces tateyamensis]
MTLTTRSRLAAGVATAALAVLAAAPCAAAESLGGPPPTAAEAARPITERVPDLVVTTARDGAAGLVGGHS